jgi:hypothetical protein
LRSLLPLPPGAKEGLRAAKQLLENPQRLAALRVRFLDLLSQLRSRGLNLVTAIGEWRSALRGSSKNYRQLPDAELPFWHRGAAFPAKLVADLAFLPMPLATDPLLIDWFDRVLPWELSHVARVSRLRRAGAMLALAQAASTGGAADAPDAVATDSGPNATAADGEEAADDAGVKHRARARLEHAQEKVLDSAVRASLSSSPEGVVKEALRRAARPSQRAWSAERWQWSAWQAVIYGDSYYLPLLRNWPAAVEGLRRGQAAATIQRIWRARTSQQFAKVVQAASAFELARQAAQVLRKKDGAARAIQSRVRGKAVRQAFVDISKALSEGTRSARGVAAEQLKAANAAKERRKDRDTAARRIQRRGRVAHARREARHKREASQATINSASNLLAQVHSVASLAATLVRHRQSQQIMWRVYEHAVLGWYEHAAAYFASAAAGERADQGSAEGVAALGEWALPQKKRLGMTKSNATKQLLKQPGGMPAAPDESADSSGAQATGALPAPRPFAAGGARLRPRQLEAAKAQLEGAVAIATLLEEVASKGVEVTTVAEAAHQAALAAKPGATKNGALYTAYAEARDAWRRRLQRAGGLGSGAGGRPVPRPGSLQEARGPRERIEGEAGQARGGGQRMECAACARGGRRARGRQPSRSPRGAQQSGSRAAGASTWGGGGGGAGAHATSHRWRAASRPARAPRTIAARRRRDGQQ